MIINAEIWLIEIQRNYLYLTIRHCSNIDSDSFRLTMLVTLLKNSKYCYIDKGLEKIDLHYLEGKITETRQCNSYFYIKVKCKKTRGVNKDIIEKYFWGYCLPVEVYIATKQEKIKNKIIQKSA